MATNQTQKSNSTPAAVASPGRRGNQKGDGLAGVRAYAQRLANYNAGREVLELSFVTEVRTKLLRKYPESDVIAAAQGEGMTPEEITRLTGLQVPKKSTATGPAAVAS